MVLTPHPKEFCSLLKLTCNEDVSIEALQANRFTYAKAWSERFAHVVLVLKGANTIIAHEGCLYVNAFGTQALAKGGSGDVLSGMIGALIAQGYSLKDAAISASLAHAFVSQKLTCNNSSLTPLDICKGLKMALKKIAILFSGEGPIWKISSLPYTIKRLNIVPLPLLRRFAIAPMQRN